MPAADGVLPRERERAGAQLYEPRNQWHADSASKKCQFMNLVCFTQISPSFILLGDLLYKSTHKDFVLSLHKTLYKWSRIEEKGKLLRNCRTIGRIYRYISSLLCQGLFES